MENKDCPQTESILEKIDRALQTEINIYAEGIAKINSKLDKFKAEPKEDLSKAKDPQAANSEYFYSFERKLETLANLNKKLGMIYNRLCEIL